MTAYEVVAHGRERKIRNRLIPLAAIVTCWGAPLATGQEAGAIRLDTAYFHVDVGGRYESLPTDVQVRPKQQVEIRLPNIPWLKPTQVLQVATTKGSRDQVQVLQAAQDPRSISEVMEICRRANRTKFRDQVFRPLIDAGWK